MKAFIAVLGSLLTLTYASAREQWTQSGRPLACEPTEQGNQLGQCQNWISKVLVPDRMGSCCGEGDAYIADSFKVGPNGESIAIITKNYSNYSEGTEIVVPSTSINEAYKDGGNPTGHGIVFITGGGIVICYFGPNGL